ncbi:hypothetical protein TGMAS_252385 [Toxoplasma gondii MAS]|uniref:Uncharacterized protein n=2 Tax=Toxoplasma gondii TaxID=5811 RepID=A0A086PPV1_TOXGO|nr:hypothetical protein TGMAS_252385 [Toxoplasma gondii MAS]PUA89171.1 hypothetical protein TGBR9_252385 [Toxoplasma gondii TgCATBr9]
MSVSRSEFFRVDSPKRPPFKIFSGLLSRLPSRQCRAALVLIFGCWRRRVRPTSRRDRNRGRFCVQTTSLARLSPRGRITAFRSCEFFPPRLATPDSKREARCREKGCSWPSATVLLARHIWVTQKKGFFVREL